MLTAENNRLGAATTKTVRRRIEAHLRWLEKELSRIDRDLEEAINESPEAGVRGRPLLPHLIHPKWLEGVFYEVRMHDPSWLGAMRQDFSCKN